MWQLSVISIMSFVGQIVTETLWCTNFINGFSYQLKNYQKKLGMGWNK